MVAVKTSLSTAAGRRSRSMRNVPAPEPPVRAMAPSGDESWLKNTMYRSSESCPAASTPKHARSTSVPGRVTDTVMST